MSKKISEKLGTSVFETIDDTNLSHVIGGLRNNGLGLLTLASEDGKGAPAEDRDNYIPVPPIV